MSSEGATRVRFNVMWGYKLWPMLFIVQGTTLILLLIIQVILHSPFTLVDALNPLLDRDGTTVHNRDPYYRANYVNMRGGRGGGSRERITGKNPYNCGIAPLNRMRSGAKFVYDPYIDNGLTVYPQEFPSFAMIKTEKSNDTHTVESICGGTLISDRHVLTAAHCVRGAYDEDVFTLVHLGGYRSSVPDYWVGVWRTCFGNHPGHDWAILRLDTVVNFTTHIQPACMPRRNPPQPITQGPESNCYLVGRGVYKIDKWKIGDKIYRKHYTPYRRVYKIRVEKSDECDDKEKFEAYDDISTCYKIAQEWRGRGAGPCKGDSGGPILCLDQSDFWTVVAVVSRTYNKDCFYATSDQGIFVDTIKIQKSLKYAQCFEGERRPWPALGRPRKPTKRPATTTTRDPFLDK